MSVVKSETVLIFQKYGSIVTGKFPKFLNEPLLVHGISTRKGGISEAPFESLNLGYGTGDNDSNVKTNRARFLQALNFHESDIVQAVQIHGNHIKKVVSSGIYEKTDGFITQTPHLPLTIRVADCMPVFLFDPVNVVIGLVHAGWQGTSKKILQTTIQEMQSQYDAKPENIQAALGPAIGPCCYAVKEDVASQFPSKYIKNNRLDIIGSNYDQLIEAGLYADHIEKSVLCTCCHQEWFFSHRCSQGRTGRMIALLAIHKNK